MKSYKELIVWQKSINIVTEAYELTKSFPKEEEYGLRSQIRRSAVSVSSNIAEGWGRQSKKSFIQFLRIARGSLYELETQLHIAKRLQYVENIEMIENELVEVAKLINGLMRKLKD